MYTIYCSYNQAHEETPREKVFIFEIELITLLTDRIVLLKKIRVSDREIDLSMHYVLENTCL